MRFVAVALAGAAVDPLRAVAIHDDYYVNRRLGLGLRKPPGWEFEAFKDFGYLNETQLYLEDELSNAEIKDLLSEPLITISRYGTRAPRFGPSIVIYADDRGGWKQSADLQGYIQDALSGWATILPQFVVREEPTSWVISNSKAVRFKASFLFMREQRAPVDASFECYEIFQDHREYSVQLFDSEDEPGSPDFEQFIQSIRVL